RECPRHTPRRAHGGRVLRLPRRPKEPRPRLLRPPTRVGAEGRGADPRPARGRRSPDASAAIGHPHPRDASRAGGARRPPRQLRPLPQPAASARRQRMFRPLGDVPAALAPRRRPAPPRGRPRPSHRHPPLRPARRSGRQLARRTLLLPGLGPGLPGADASPRHGGGRRSRAPSSPPMDRIAMNEREVIVIGCGIAGPAVALFLRRAGFSPRIYEAAPAPRDEEGAFFNLAPNGMHVLRALGAEPDVRRMGHRTLGLAFHNEAGKEIARLDGRRDEELFGAPSSRTGRRRRPTSPSAATASTPAPAAFSSPTPPRRASPGCSTRAGRPAGS